VRHERFVDADFEEPVGGRHPFNETADACGKTSMA
jgi:hypothetical protein